MALFDYLRSAKTLEKPLLSLVHLTQHSSLAFGVSWYEPRLRRYQKAIFAPYPELVPADRLGFIYNFKVKLKGIKRRGITK